MPATKSSLLLFFAFIVIAGCAGDQSTTDDGNADTSSQEPQDQTALNQTLNPKTKSTPTVNLTENNTPALKVELPNPMQNAMLVTTSREAFENESAKNTTSVEFANNKESKILPTGDRTNETFVSTLRTWKDDKGLFSTSAELLAVSTSSREIRLLKENGNIITVPFDRLSNHDKNFVTLFIDAERQKVRKITPQLVESFD